MQPTPLPRPDRHEDRVISDARGNKLDVSGQCESTSPGRHPSRPKKDAGFYPGEKANPRIQKAAEASKRFGMRRHAEV